MPQETLKVLVCGAAGRMGQRLVQLVAENPYLNLVGALDRVDSPFIGKDAGLVAGLGNIRVPISGDFSEASKNAEVYLDFSTPEGVSRHLVEAVPQGLKAVIGVTALSNLVEDQIREAAKKLAILLAPNLSYGVNLLYKIAKEMAHLLDRDYDIEITEAHHNRKKDAPSGTALKLHDILCQARGLDPEAAKRPGRSGVLGPRTREEIGIHSIRGGDTIGEHTVTFYGPGEMLSVHHLAQSRDAFATGAIRAAQWIRDKGPGLYSFESVLGIGATS